MMMMMMMLMMMTVVVVVMKIMKITMMMMMIAITKTLCVFENANKDGGILNVDDSILLPSRSNETWGF